MGRTTTGTMSGGVSPVGEFCQVGELQRAVCHVEKLVAGLFDCVFHPQPVEQRALGLLLAGCNFDQAPKRDAQIWGPLDSALRQALRFEQALEALVCLPRWQSGEEEGCENLVLTEFYS